MLPVSTLVRRSVLLVSLDDADGLAGSWRHNADAIALELPADIRATRVAAPDAIHTAARGGAEVFVRIDKRRAYAQIKAAVTPDLTGVVLPDAEAADDVLSVAAMLAEREREEGIPEGQLEIFAIIGSARGVWNARQVVNASQRVRCTALDEVSLCRSLSIVPSDEFDPFGFGRGRVIVETLAAVKLPLGLAHPLGAQPREVGREELLRVADAARNSGFKGAVCPFPSWVEPCNVAFTPTDEQLSYYRDVRAAFAEGVKRGTAAVPFAGGRMIDVPVDERAKLVIDWWDRCRKRDAEKNTAMSAQWPGR